MAHADHDWIRIITERIRQSWKQLGREPAIMMDVKGPEIRTGYLHHADKYKKNDLLDLVSSHSLTLLDQRVYGKLR